MFHLLKQPLPAKTAEIRTLYDLKRYKHWACHDCTGLPVSPVNGQATSCDDSQSWGTYEQAHQYWLRHSPQIVGLGFMLTPDLGITVITLDNCLVAGHLNDFAREIVEVLDAYTEISPNGNGLHIWVQTNLATHAEIYHEPYEHVRYIPITGTTWREE